MRTMSNLLFGILSALAVGLMVIANPSIVFGAERELAVEFAYTPAEPSQAAVAYNIYAGDTLVCTPQVGVDPNVLFCDAAELASGPYDWTMEAILRMV